MTHACLTISQGVGVHLAPCLVIWLTAITQASLPNPQLEDLLPQESREMWTFITVLGILKFPSPSNPLLVAENTKIPVSQI